jgi:phospholipase C
MRRTILLVMLLASLAQGQSLKHIIIIVKENRSFDHYFGQFPGVTGGPITSYNCVGTEGGCSGGTLAVIPGNPNLPDADCGHYFANSTSDYNTGLMNQFNENCSGSSDWAKQYGPTTIPTYWSYATNYGLADHMFASVMGPSYPNHLYMIAATSNETQDNAGMTPGAAPNGLGGNIWTCDAFHYGRCSTNATILCSTNTDCIGNGTCNIDLGTGHCSVTTTAPCTLDSDCAASGGGYCSNGNTYTGSFYGIDIQGGTGKEMYPGVCSTHRTVGCNSICTGSTHNCDLTFDCSVTSPTANCNIADPNCTALNDVCDAPSKQFLSAARGSACPNVTTIADLLDAANVTWGIYYQSGNAPNTNQQWNPAGYVQHIRYGSDWTTNIHPSGQFATDAAACVSDSNCNLPSVVWIDSTSDGSEHPPSLVSVGEAWTATQVNAVMSNAYLWSNSTIFILWDDFGGFADHIAPSQDTFNWTNGIRVPLLCVGRFCKNQITSTVFTHASMLKCIENTFGISALISGVDGAANDACFATGGMMSVSQNNPFPGSLTTTTIASSANPSAFGQTVTFTATVTANLSGSPTGTVTFSDGTTSLGSSALTGGTATLSTATLAVGIHSIKAVYSGDSNFSSSSAMLSQTINQASTTVALLSGINPSSLGESVTFTATITPQYSGQASGTVTFKDGSATLGSAAVSNDVANFTTSALAVGTHSITAVYGGDGNFTGSTSSVLSQVVTKATTTTSLTSSINPSVSGKPVTFTATVSSPAGTPTGKVQFLNGTASLATVTLSAGVAKYTTSALPSGTNVITAVYEGDANNNGSTSAAVDQVVLVATTTTLASSPNPSGYGQSVLLTAKVTSSLGVPPNGEAITFNQGTTMLGTGNLNGGTATFSTSTLAVGTKGLNAVYGGDSRFNTSTSSTVNQVIDKATTTATLTSSQNPTVFGQSVTFTATVAPQFTGTPTGTVTFMNGTATLKVVTLSGDMASYTTTTLAVGTESITAVYNGSTSFTGSTSNMISQVVNQASSTTTLVSSQNPSKAGQSVTFTATVSPEFTGTPAGTVIFKDGTTTLKTVTLGAGVAKYTTSTLASGTHQITATYNGDVDFTTSSVALTQTVN